jgi:ABC-type proline/glycine betaine transport system ATPase subunit
MAEALLLADRVGVMNAGRLLQIGTPAELLRAPADEHVASLLATPRRQARRLDELLGEVT